jgi:ribose 1,5-bisphosphate isomerase
VVLLELEQTGRQVGEPNKVFVCSAVGDYTEGRNHRQSSGRQTVDSRIRTAIEILARDNKSGASEILTSAARVFSIVESTIDSTHSDIESALSTVVETSLAIIRAQPDMAPMLNLANAAVISAANGSTVSQAVAFANKAAADFAEHAASAAAAVATLAANRISPGSTLLTHSRSSTVVAALLAAHRAGKKFQVIATESRPMLEGRSLCSELAGQGVSVTLIADSAAAEVMRETDLILLGADRITPFTITNKIGTKMIALAARERGVPILVACDSTKFTSLGRTDNMKKERPAEELWSDSPKGVSVRNFYFEDSPLSLFDNVITDLGELDAKRASTLASEKQIDKRIAEAMAGA